MADLDIDAQLVAYIDKQLDAEAARALETRLQAEPDLRVRLDMLKTNDLALASAFAAMLADAPVDKMQAALIHILDKDAKSTNYGLRRTWARAGGLAAAACLVLVGFGLGRLMPASPEKFAVQNVSSPEKQPDKPDDWRSAVAEYAALYTTDTFLTRPVDTAAQTADLAQLGARLKVALTPESLNLSDLTYRGMQILGYDGVALGQVAYSNAAGKPVLFCIIAKAETDAPVQQESRNGLASASWADNGRGYMIIGDLPPKQIAELADALHRRF